MSNKEKAKIIHSWDVNQKAKEPEKKNVPRGTYDLKVIRERIAKKMKKFRGEG